MSAVATADELKPLPGLLARVLSHRVSPATIFRWHRKGVKVGNERVKLRVLRIGAKLYSTEEDVQAFIAAQNPPDDAQDSEDQPRDAATERRLEKAGLI